MVLAMAVAGSSNKESLGGDEVLGTGTGRGQVQSMRRENSCKMILAVV